MMASSDGGLSPLRSWQWHKESGEELFLYWLCIGLNIMFLGAAVTLALGVQAPYGRYNQGQEKQEKKNFIMRLMCMVDMPAKLAWAIQECPTLFWAAYSWYTAPAAFTLDLGNRVVLLCFIIHYINRTIIFPLRSRGSKPIPLPVMLMACMFCFANGYIQSRSLTNFMSIPLMAPTTIIGVAMWALGMYLNMDADHVLRNLRKPGETGYKIPKGGLFDYVSGANFAAEILEWAGFAVASGFALPCVTFAFCSMCNIGPRAVSHHQWYKEKFAEEYPKERKALIPFVF